MGSAGKKSKAGQVDRERQWEFSVYCFRRGVYLPAVLQPFYHSASPQELFQTSFLIPPTCENLIPQRDCLFVYELYVYLSFVYKKSEIPPPHPRPAVTTSEADITLFFFWVLFFAIVNKTEVAAFKRSQSNLRTFTFKALYLLIMVLYMSSSMALGEKF